MSSSPARPRYHLHLPGAAGTSRTVPPSPAAPVTYKITVERLDGVGCSETEALEAMSIYCIEQFGTRRRSRRHMPRRRRKDEVMQ